MNQITTTGPTPRTDRRKKARETSATTPAPSACDIALEGMIVLLARHISREMTSVDEAQEMVGDAGRQRVSKIG
ncbi:hypothetical protein [Sulfitobacter sp. D7]|uniref:hypothetical protein n=1 Tax=Sulfitobacter sp. D7 TaxID=1968541 RepID=UPI000E773DD2|nr:hypothetical protein [Sulfitobacter sp. D7]AYE85067.1 hypothetical protein B5M07_02475 [Sulfitobacter sp. D7]